VEIFILTMKTVLVKPVGIDILKTDWKYSQVLSRMYHTTYKTTIASDFTNKTNTASMVWKYRKFTME
jgi:hypothetical protein